VARFMPFRAVHFDPRVVGGDLGPVIAPPYDVVDSALGERLAARHPYNAVRLELTVPVAGGSPERYREAASLWTAWRRAGILVRDGLPAFYLCEHEFWHGGRRLVRTAVVGTLTVAAGVLAHEDTMAQPKEDRLHLLRACRAQFSPILALYEDPEGSVAAALREARGDDPDLQAVGEGEALRAWRVTAEDAIERVTAAVGSGPVVIADGHHRYESARRFAGETGEEGHRRVLAALVATTDPGLVVLPTHRVVRRISPGVRDQIMERVRGAFTTEPIPGDIPFGCEDRAASWWEAFAPPARSEDGHIRLVAVTDQGAWALGYRGETAEALKLLDGILSEAGVAARGILGEAGAAVEYTRDAVCALREVLGGRARAAFFPPAVSVGEVFRKAREGFRFPRKTTYFHPKVPAGLLMCDLDD